jgi:hypothetical protein
MYSNSPKSPKQKQEDTSSYLSKLIKKVRLYHAPVTFCSLLLQNEGPTSTTGGSLAGEEINEQEENRKNSVNLGVEIFDTDDTLTEIPESLTEGPEEEAVEEDSFSSTSNDSDLDSNKYDNVKQKNLLRP